ncbi:MAG: APC family permease, partial [Pseudonocardia sp.]|nr:APC family permease [Pseudonocardia sp.]
MAQGAREQQQLNDDAVAPGRGEHHKLTALGGLAALSLDALSSVAYGPEAIVLVLVGAGISAVRFTLPITIAITVLLIILVVSYSQVIAVHPDGGGAYAVAKAQLGRTTSLLAAASLIVDYVLTVAVSLAAGAASLGSVAPWFAHHLLSTCLFGLLVLTVINLLGVAESARVLMLPTLVFLASIAAVIIVGLARSHPVAVIGTDLGPVHATEAVGVVLILKAFASGCSALTGVEAIANGVPAFRAPAVRRAQRTEIALGVLLGVLLLGLAALIKVRHSVPRGNVTILAQLSAGAFGTGWAFYVSNLSVTLVLAFAANTSFGGLPVLMSLLAKDHRLPHLFALRSERPVYRYGVVALALFAGLLLITIGADTHRLLPLFAIGVFIGFTISQVGLVRHWLDTRSPGWLPRAILNGTGALLSALAAVIFFASKFTEGAWLLLLIIPALIALFGRIERYYRLTGEQLGVGQLPDRPARPRGAGTQLVLVPVSSANRLAKFALDNAQRMGGQVEAVCVDADHSVTRRLSEDWERWDPGTPLRILPSPHRTLVS